ncbi:MAG: murein biosynthesis integral membrane protein MurJ [Planctomycetes bacterium]|nr:murein biosynthesis integral membrane protein MurJ [Planctomycetota bacterium]
MMDREESADKEQNQRAGGLFSGLRIVSLCTLVSRVLGFIRELAIAGLWGLSPVSDAFIGAFRIPNLARALFGEGALSAAFTPLFVREQEQLGRNAAMQLASSVFVWLGLRLTALVAVVELVIAATIWLAPLGAELRLWLVLTTLMLPYLPLICLTAQMGAVLNALGRFAWPALLPVLFNVSSLAAIWVLQRFELTAEDQAHWLAGFVVLTGFLQLAAPWPQLWRLGFRLRGNWLAMRDRIRELLSMMAPVVIGLSITQVNTFCDTLIALVMSRPQDVAASAWRPLEFGTASALNLGQRLYQFPLGILGVALGTVIFPVLTRHAERGDWQRLRDDLSLGLRLVFLTGMPASAGLWLLADPLAVVLFQRGNVTDANAQQIAEMIAAYGLGVWAFCGLLIVQRGYYAIGDRITPLRIGLSVVVVNLLLNFGLIFWIGGRGLALSTSLCGILQFGLCLLFIQGRIGRLPWWSLASHAGRAVLAVLGMTAVAWLVLQQLAAGAMNSSGRLLQLCATILAAIVSYALLAAILRLDEFWMLLRPDRDAE